MIKKIFLYAIAISCVFLLVQGVKTGFDVNAIKNKITDSINNVNEDSSNNNDSGNTTNVSAYSNLVVSEQAPEDKNSIWVKSNNNITNVEYSNKGLFEYSKNSSFAIVADCVNESNYNNMYRDCIYENGILYKFNEDSSNFYIAILENNNLINKITINQSHSSFSCSFAMSDNYYFILDGYNSTLYKYSRIDNSLISKNTYSFGYSNNSNKSACMYYSYTNNYLYIDYYVSYPMINIIDISNDYLIGTYCPDGINPYSQTSLHNKFLCEYNDYIYIDSYQGIFKLNINDNSFTSIDRSNFLGTGNKIYIYIDNEYIYNYCIVSTKNIVESSNSTITSYVLEERILNLYDNSIVVDNYYYLDSTCSGSDFYFYVDKYQDKFDIYINSFSNSSYKYLYKLTKNPVEASNNTLYIIDSEYNKNYNVNPIYIKFNNIFGYTLYKPKFYLANSSGNLIKANTYIYNTTSNLWQLI